MAATATDLQTIAKQLVAEGKGILAADESSGTIKKRLDSIGVESNEDNRRAYRELLFTTEGMEEYISGVILYDETIRQTAEDGTPFPELLESRGIIPGIKVDLGAKPLAGASGETITEGLDGLRERLAEYYELGARFTKWRAVISIGPGLPSDYCMWTNAHALARYAALSQEGGLVPIVEPEVLMEGDHTIEQSYHVTVRVLQALYTEMFDQRVEREGTLLKTNMVVSGYDCPEQADVDDRGRGDDPLPEERGTGHSAGRRVPLGRHVRRGRDRAPERDEPARPTSVGALVLVRARSPGACAESLGRSGGERRGRPEGVLPPRQVQRRGPIRLLRTRMGDAGSHGLNLVRAHVERFNAGVRSGDFGPMVEEGFADNAELAFEGVPVGPFRGKEAIARAYAEQPPDDEVAILRTNQQGDEMVVVDYAWLAAPNERAGTMIFRLKTGKIDRLLVTFG